MLLKKDINKGGKTMRKKENISLNQYFYCVEERLENALKDCNYRYVRRDLDSIDLLEEIIARERLNCFKELRFDILRILKLNEAESE